jgi:hypothetical protein
MSTHRMALDEEAACNRRILGNVQQESLAYESNHDM